MALTELLFQTRKASIGVIELDASVREQHRSTARVTDHPVEPPAPGGGRPDDISDHVQVMPDTITIEGVITNTPAEATAVVATIEGTDPVGDAYRRLLEDLKGKRLITVITTLRTYNDIVLEECNVDRNAQRGNALFFTASGRQVRKVTAQTVDVPAPVQTTKAAGKKPTKPPAPKVEAQAQSLTSKLVGLVLP